MSLRGVYDAAISKSSGRVFIIVYFNRLPRYARNDVKRTTDCHAAIAARNDGSESHCEEFTTRQSHVAVV